MDATVPSVRSPHLLLIVSPLGALAYWLLQGAAPSLLSLACKLIPIVALAAWAWPRTQGCSRLAPLALLMHAGGDGLLEWMRMGAESAFLPAVGAFLAGHMLNFALFRRLSAGRWCHPQLAACFAVVTVGAGSVVLHALWQNDASPGLQVAVPIYMAVLLVMALAAQRVRSVAIGYGAAGYLLSDALFGLDRFAGLFAHAGFAGGWLVWPSYYLAQCLLCAGLVGRFGKENTAWIPR